MPAGQPATSWEAGVRVTSTRPKQVLPDPPPPKRAPNVYLNADELQAHKPFAHLAKKENEKCEMKIFRNL
ncbi:hypothetical protein D3C79_500760 [compost metagenome]|jgi:hypothetical protein